MTMGRHHNTWERLIQKELRAFPMKGQKMTIDYLNRIDAGERDFRF